MIRNIIIVLALAAATGCTILSDSNPELNAEPTLSTPIEGPASSAVQDIEIKEQAEYPQPDLTSTAVPTQAVIRADLDDLGPAPELVNEIWLNTDQPLRLSDLGGRVVLLEMWTFGLINCRNVIPSLREWHKEYNSQGLVIIGNHYPEFGYEEDLENLKGAVKELDIQYPVAQDNEGDTWRAYNNRYWPTLYLIDKNGHIRYIHIGEGRYAETEGAIQALLSESYP